MAQVEVVSEQESAGGWTFVVQVLDDDGTLRRHDVSLSWADYNLWSRSGGDEPADVAAGAVGFLLSRIEPDALRPAMDVSIARRMFPDADESIPGFICRS